MSFADLRVSDLIRKPPVTASPEETVGTALGRMERLGVSTLFVVRGRRVEGVVTHRQIVEKGLPPTAKIQTCMEPTPTLAEDDTAPQAARLLVQGPAKALPVARSSEVIGSLSRRDLVVTIGDSEEFSAHPLRGLISHPAKTIRAKATLAKAREKMRKEGIRRLTVTDARGQLIGIITVADIAGAVYRWRSESATLGDRRGESHPRLGAPVKGLMSKPVHTVALDESISSAARVMTEVGVSGLPVLNELGELVGVITEADIIRHVAAQPREKLYPIEILGVEGEAEYLKQIALDALTDTARRISTKAGKIHHLRVMVKTYEKGGSRKKYSVSTQLKLTKGQFSAKASDWSLTQALQESLERLRKQVVSQLERREEESLKDKSLQRRQPLEAFGPPGTELGRTVRRSKKPSA